MRLIRSFLHGVRVDGLRHELGYRWWQIGFKVRPKHPLGMVVVGPARASWWQRIRAHLKRD